MGRLPPSLSAWAEHTLAEARNGKPWELRGSEPGELPRAKRHPCQAVVSGVIRTGKPPAIALRCHCMAETWNPPSPRYYNYDPVGIVDTIEDLELLWQSHLKGRADGS